ncbi:O-antigen ligase family protein [Pseudomonadota bacterium]
MGDKDGHLVLPSVPSNLFFIFSSFLFVSSVVASLFFNGMHAEYFALAMCLLVIWWVALCWKGIPAKRGLFGGPLLLALGTYQGWLVLTLMWNPAPYLGLNYFALLATPFLVVFAWNMTPSPDRLWGYIWPMLMALSVVLMVYSLYQYYWLRELPHATFVNRNSLAAILSLLVMIAVSRVMLTNKGHKWGLVLLLSGIATAALLVGLIGSRGAFLGLVCGLLVLIYWGMLNKSDLRRRVWMSVAAICAGIAISNLPFMNIQGHLLTERVGALSDPYSAGNDRFLIWGQSLEMVQDKPLQGHGLGTYWQHWPQWRDPADSTAGYWAHNDFLHIGVEAGLPSVLLLFIVHIVLLYLAWRVITNAQIGLAQKSEVATLLAGLLAVAVHAQFTFNYYNLPIVLLLSLMMARIARHELDASVEKRKVAIGAGRQGVRLFIPLFGLLAGYHFVCIGIGTLFFNNAIEEARQGNVQVAEQSFDWAHEFWGTTDIIPYSHALLKEQQLAKVPIENSVQRGKIFQEGQALLDVAIDNNPLRAVPYFIRGRLLVTAAELAGNDWLENAESSFRESIKRDPLYLESRLTLARILEVTGRQVDADILLEEGAMYRYAGDDPKSLTYYKMLAAARNRAGNLKGAADVIERYNQIVRGLMEKQRVEQASKP